MLPDSYYDPKIKREHYKVIVAWIAVAVVFLILIFLTIMETLYPSFRVEKVPKPSLVETSIPEVTTVETSNYIPTSTPTPTIPPTATPTPSPTSTPTPTPSPTPEVVVTPVESQPEYSEPTRDDVDGAESILTARMGVNYNINGNRETWYNLPMEGVISIMRGLGFTEEEYPYWIREDGCRMLGDYIMVAANHDIYPRGSVIHTSLGDGLVCDTGSFIYTYPTGIDIAVNW